MSPTNPESTPEDVFRVVVFERPDDPHVIRDALVEHTDLNATDAAIHVRRLPGVIDHDLPHDVAAHAATAIRNSGPRATIIAVSDLPDLEKKLMVHHIRCLPDGFEILDLRGERDRLIPWSDISMISVGYVPQDAAEHTTSPQFVIVGATHYRREETTKLGTHKGPQALIAATHPSQLICIDHGLMNYEYLGDRLSESATNNFRELMNDLARFATKATIAPEAQAFLEKRPLGEYEFETTQEHHRSAVFHAVAGQ